MAPSSFALLVNGASIAGTLRSVELHVWTISTSTDQRIADSSGQGI